MKSPARLFRPRMAALIGASLAMALPATSALALTFHDMKFTCPLDGETFTAREVTSQSQFGMRLDLKPIGALLAPIPMPVCPTTGFVMFKDEYTKAEIATLRPIVLSKDYQRARQANTDYYMAAYLRERMGATGLELGQLYLKASWEAEARSADLTRQYRLLALDRFDTALKKTAESGEWWNAAVVSAELLRLLGRFEAAEKRLDDLPVAHLAADSVLLEVIRQIRAHARNQNASPEPLERR